MSNARSRARRLAMQGLYEWAVSRNTPQDILLQYRDTPQFAKVEAAYFAELLSKVPQNIEAIDELLAGYVSRPIAEIDPVELAILRLATYELLHRPDVPYRVVINEAIELAKTFGAEDGHRFVNGILDKVALEVRKAETARART